ncbi:leucyl aminopeptidase [Devosia rhodophyticola]|uniref:Probable cytosol aminopeptidase n=1 Tax=Devosia rhodophyticola TaxID=3026423 RepID=A0ABY7YW58_9HYPH|nr:leucyl aminopeptidase [Devosia rhodophyticola]WDR05603.1 leucyl aminopeptidase [Devosia rhodophyticola]
MPQYLLVRTAPLSGASADLLVIYAAEGKAPSGMGQAVWAGTGHDWEQTAKSGSFAGKQGQVLDIMGPAGTDCQRLLVLGSGNAEASSLTAWTDRGGSLMNKIANTRARNIAVIVDEADATPEAIAELVAGVRLRHYRFDKYKSKADEDRAGDLTITIHVADVAKVDAAIADRGAVVAGTMLARDLVNEPANVLGPLEFAEKASGLAALGVEVEILSPEEMRALGMESLLCVAQGSERPARLVVMQWHGGETGDAPLAFVGKGVVFDTGGISIKPASSMEDMKGDMGGAAAVVGLMHALATRKSKANVVGVIGLVENMPDGKSVRPGDVIKAMSGTTIEVINTDAEGRLVLADALWYTQDRFKPRFMIDLATLTGAILVALGHEHAGLFANDDALAGKLLAAGMASNEKLWRLPLAPSYNKMIESRVADIKNSAGRLASSITAAHFLERFVNGVPWAHLDIAGMAFGGGSTKINESWGSGFGVALLDRLVRDSYEL